MTVFTPPVIGNETEIPNAGRGLQRWHNQNATGTTNTEAYRRTGLEWSYHEGAVPGNYTWNTLDQEISTNAARGQRTIIAIATTRGSDTYSGAWVPSYLLEKDANGVRKYGAWYPFATGTDGNEPVYTTTNGVTKIGSGFLLDWGNLYVRERWTAFLIALANRYDGDPRVLAIDMTAVGTFGEWYISNSAPTRVKMNDEKRMWVIDSYHAAFTKTPLRMGTDDGPALKLCYDKYPLDSWYRMSWCRHTHFDGNLHTKYDGYAKFWDRWKTANSPIGVETYGVNFTIDSVAVQDIIDNHVSLIGDGNFVTVSYANRSEIEKEYFKEAGRKAGYRYVIRSATAPDPAPGNWTFGLTIENIGCAPTYDNWEVVVQLRSSEYTTVWEGVLDTANLKTLIPGSPVPYEKIFVLPSSIQSGFKYRLNVVVRDKNPNLAGLSVSDNRRFVLRNLVFANGGTLDDRSIYLGEIGTGTPPPPPPTGNLSLRTPIGVSVDNLGAITTPAIPSAQDDDQFYVAFVLRNTSATFSLSDSGTLTPWKDIVSGSTIRMLVYKHRYDPVTSPANWTLTLNGGITTDMQAFILPAGGNDELIPIDNGGTAVDDEPGASGGVQVAVGPITTVTANTRLIAFVATAFTFNDVTSTGGVMTRLAQYRSSVPNVGITSAIFEQEFPTPGATGTRTFDYSAGRSCALLFALKPAAVAPPPVVPNVTITPELVGYEGTNNDSNRFRVFVDLNIATTVDVLLNWKLTPITATVPGDVTVSSLTGTWTIQAGRGQDDDLFFSLAITDDLLSEPDETFQFEITSVNNATLTGYPSGGWTFTIKDDDQTTATAYFAGYNDAIVSNGSVNDSFFEHSPENIMVELDTPLAYQTTLTFTTTPIGWTENTHYTVSPSNKQLVFAPGETTKTITITPINDAIQNVPRSLTVQLGSGNGLTIGSPRTINYVVKDDDTVAPPPPLSRPSIPTGFTGFELDYQAQLFWHAVQTVSFYDIQRSVENTSTPVDLSPNYLIQPDRFTDDELTPGTTYFYRIRAGNTAGVSDWTDWVRIDIPGLPPAPIPSEAPILSGSIENESVVYLQWTVVPNSADFEVRVSTNLATYTSIGKAGTNFKRHTPDTSGGIHDFYYQVRALNNVGQPGPWSNVLLFRLVVQPAGTIGYTTKERVWPAEEYATQDVIDGVRLAIEDVASVLMSDSEILLYVREAMRASQKHFVEIERLVYKLPDVLELPVSFYIPKDYHKYEPLSIRSSIPGFSQRINRFEWKREVIELMGYPVKHDKGYYEIHYMTPCEVPILSSDKIAVPRAWLIAATLVRLLPLYAKRTGTDQTFAIQEQMNRAMSEFQSAVRVPILLEDGTVR